MADNPLKKPAEDHRYVQRPDMTAKMARDFLATCSDDAPVILHIPSVEHHAEIIALALHEGDVVIDTASQHGTRRSPTAATVQAHEARET